MTVNGMKRWIVNVIVLLCVVQEFSEARVVCRKFIGRRRIQRDANTTETQKTDDKDSFCKEKSCDKECITVADNLGKVPDGLFDSEYTVEDVDEEYVDTTITETDSTVTPDPLEEYYRLLAEEQERRDQEEKNREKELKLRAEEEVRRAEELVRREEELKLRAEEAKLRKAERVRVKEELVRRDEELERRKLEEKRRDAELERRNEELERREQEEKVRKAANPQSEEEVEYYDDEEE